MDGLRGIESFIKAVQAGSIAGGARALGISPAAASQNIARLEKNLGTRLLTRTTRSLALTERVQELMRELELANQAVSAVNDELRGRRCRTVNSERLVGSSISLQTQEPCLRRSGANRIFSVCV